MLRSHSLFGQVLSLISRAEFARHVKALRAERYAKGFRAWDQLVGMLFCHLAQARSLREISNGLRCCLGKLSHLGMVDAPARSTLSYANGHRPWQLFARVFEDLLGTCREVAPRHRFRFRNPLYSLDATVIDLCQSMFDWARYTKAKGAVKLHLLLDHDGHLPGWALLTEGRVHEVRVARLLALAPDSVVVFDRGYTDYALFAEWDDRGVWFVTRMKSNARYAVMADWTGGAGGAHIRADQVVRLEGMDRDLRRVVVWDAQKQEEVVFLTNQMRFAASTIAAIYRQRWQIELFFKALKQHLRIKTFVGTSANAVHTQIWTALIAILLLKYLQFRSRQGWSLSNLVALVRLNLFTYRDLWRWIDDPYDTPPHPPDGGTEQLLLDSILQART
jgi:hypothetical protein